VRAPHNKPLHLSAAGFCIAEAVLHTLRDSIGARPQVSGKPLGG
jgi:hypothetical protein